MFRSLSRITVAVAFVLALLLSTVPAHAIPGDTESPGITLDTSWLDVALGWLEDFLGFGSDSGQLQSTATGGRQPLSGSCIDPWGNPCGDNL
ncbi:MAG TPA: hypothetical protein VKM72_16560 [Thermoanaerobaculia bacterium]|nr:hypothetical protein [Thermoanaerobaculia bacterium]